MRTLFVTYSATLLSVAAFGCTQPTGTSPPAPSSVVAVISASGASSALSAPQTPPTPSPFHVVATSSTPFQVYRLDNALIVHSGSFLGRLEQDKIAPDLKMGTGLGLGHEEWQLAFVERIFGSWPDEAWALVRGATGRSGYSIAFRFQKEVWKRQAATPVGDEVGAVFHDSKGWIGVWFQQMMGTHGLTPLSGERGFAKPSEVSVAEKKECGVLPSTVRTRVRVTHAAVGADQTVYAMGSWDDCAKEYSEAQRHSPTKSKYLASFPAVDVWTAKANAWQSVPLPSGEGDAAIGAYATTPTGLLVSAGSKLFKLHGTEVSTVDLPKNVIAPLRAIDHLPSGELVIADSKGAVFRFVPGGPANALTLPTIDTVQAWPFGIWAVADDDILVAACDYQVDFDTGNCALLRTRPMRSLAVSQEKAVGEALQREPPRPYFASCQRPLALLYELPNTTAKDFAFDTTAKAIASNSSLHGYEFIDFMYGGKRYFAARLKLTSDDPGKDVDYNVRAKPLLKAVEAGVAGARPKLVCHNPTATRVLKFSGATGMFAVAKAER